MGPFEEFVNKRCVQLLSITEYFPEYEDNFNGIVDCLKSWTNPYIIKAIEAKYDFLHKKLGIDPDAFLTLLQASCQLVSNQVNEEMRQLYEQGMLPYSPEECIQLYRVKLSEQMARLYNLDKDSYLKACGG